MPQRECRGWIKDDPVGCEELCRICSSTERGLHEIKHEGSNRPKVDFDRMVKIAASQVASKLICNSHQGPRRNVIGLASLVEAWTMEGLTSGNTQGTFARRSLRLGHIRRLLLSL